MQSSHGCAAVDQPSDGHAVVKQQAFLGDDVDLARGREPANLGRRGHARGAVADDDDFRDAGLQTEIDLRLLFQRFGKVARIHFGVDYHAATQRPAHACHPRPAFQTKPAQRCDLVIGRLAQSVAALDDRDGVCAAHPHAAAEVDADAGGFDALQQ